MKKISIVVPVYNVEKYLDDCIASIVNQNYKDIEIILVDDGSIDLSNNICNTWAEKDQRIRVFHKSNGGLMSAWKYGVERATGDYIGFVDSDDWIDENMYSVLVEMLLQNDSDLALCGLIKEFESGQHSEKEVLLLSKDVYDRDAIVQEIYPIAISSGTIPSRGISPNRVTKLYRRELLMHILPLCDETVSIGEDLLSTFACIINADRISIVHEFYPYHYRINSDSMIKKYSSAKYNRVRDLNRAILRVEKLVSYDFKDQIATDYISLILYLMEEEILFSGFDDKRLKMDLKREFDCDQFQQSLKHCDILKLRKKHKLFLSLLKYNLLGLMIFIRRSKN